MPLVCKWGTLVANALDVAKKLRAHADRLAEIDCADQHIIKALADQLDPQPQPGTETQ